MYCNNCGAELREGVVFCEQCGTPVSGGNMHEENLKPKRNKKPLIITIITLVILFTIGVLTVAQTGILNPVQHNLNLGYKYLEEGRYEEAVIAFEKVLKIDKNNMTSFEICDYLIEEAKVVGVPGDSYGFGGEKCIRFSFATDLNDLKETVKRIEVALAKL